MQTLRVFIILVLITCNVSAQQTVQKTNQMKVYMHYMPWFETPESNGGWGWHWTMSNKNPNTIVDQATGKRQIASHYYPLIGAYASSDKDVIEYHLLLMKYAGIDGVLIDWYGVKGTNGDIKSLLRNSDSIISMADDYGLQFGLILEDRFTSTIDNAKANFVYAKENYFNKANYIRTGAANQPMVGIFGPVTFKAEAQWNQILPEAGEEIQFLTLWNQKGDAGKNADGEYAWIYQDQNSSHSTLLQNFYSTRATQLETVMGIAYPGFNDFYEEGGAGAGYFYIPHNDGQTLDATLTLARQYKGTMDMLQLATWNDFGEGTIFEPTFEFKFQYLKKIQEFTGVSYSEKELDMIHKLFLLRKEKSGNSEVQSQLNQASQYLSNLNVDNALAVIQSIDATYNPPLGILDRPAKEDSFLLFPNPLKDNSFTIKTKENDGGSAVISISDAAGRLVCSRKLSKGINESIFSSNGIGNGVYLVQVRTGAIVHSKKLIINHQ